jgi:hypothetical protein
MWGNTRYNLSITSRLVPWTKHIVSGLLCICSSTHFFARPNRCRCSHKWAHTQPYEPTHVYPTPMSTSEKLSWTDKSRDWWSRHKCLAVDEHVAYHWKNSAVKSWNKSKKIRWPMSNRGIKPRWAGSFTRNLTN